MEKDYAIAKVNLLEIIPAYEFSRLISVINDVYDNFLWVDYIRSTGSVPYTFQPGEEDQLNIVKAEIGRRNRIEFLGIRQHLISTIHYLGTHYNSLLNLEVVYFLKSSGAESMSQFLKNLQKEKGKKKIENKKRKSLLKPSPSLEYELEDLSKSRTLEEDIVEEKFNFINYLRNISLTAENIIRDTEIIVVDTK